MPLLARISARAIRRPFGRFESWFYESAGAAAVADALGPRFEARLGDAHRVLDVGCGGGVLAVRLAGSGRSVVGVEPSPPQIARARAAGVEVLEAGAEQVPVEDASFDGIVSSCSIKHWSDLDAGLAGCLRAVRPGGPVVVAEIDGASTARRLRGFARTTRIPRPLHPIYPAFAWASMVVSSPTGDDLVEALTRAGAVDVGHEQLPDLPFVLAWGHRPR